MMVARWPGIPNIHKILPLLEVKARHTEKFELELAGLKTKIFGTEVHCFCHRFPKLYNKLMLKSFIAVKIKLSCD